jgi:hypothetical protein
MRHFFSIFSNLLIISILKKQIPFLVKKTLSSNAFCPPQVYKKYNKKSISVVQPLFFKNLIR